MKIVKKILIIFVEVILFLILAFNIYNIVSLKIMKKDLTTVGGYGVLEVISGSMEPKIHIGDLIIINTNVKNYKTNDIVTYKDEYNAFVTHQIITIEDDKIITKGTNNNSEDKAITKENIIGKYEFKITGAGKIIKALKSPLTLIMIFIIGLLLCIYFSLDKNGKVILDSEEEYQEFMKYKEEKEKKK